MELSREAQILAFVFDYGPLTLGQIRDLTEIPLSPVKRILKALRSRGLIRYSGGNYFIPDEMRIRGGRFAWRRRQERIRRAYRFANLEYLQNLAESARAKDGRTVRELSRLYRERLEERLQEVESDS